MFKSLREWRPSGPLLGLVSLLGLFLGLVAWQGELRQYASLLNLQTLLHQNSAVAVIALGMLLVILTGGIDLSVGSAAALAAVVTMRVHLSAQARGCPESQAGALAVACGLLVGTLCGLANGLLITRLRIAPFVATLGMMSAARGLAFWVTDKKRIDFKGPPPGWVASLQEMDHPWLAFSPGVWSVPLLALLLWLVLRYTVFGRHCRAVGSNEAAARLCGVPVEWRKAAAYTLAGLMAGWAGLLMLAQGSRGDPNTGAGLELEAIAAVVIGGASLEGGRGGVGGTLLGVLILGVVGNGLGFLSVPVEAKFVLVGTIIVINAALSKWQEGRREG